MIASSPSTSAPAPAELPPRAEADLRRAQARLVFMLGCGLALVALALFHLLLRRQLLLDGLVLLSLAAVVFGRILTDSRLSALWEGDLLRLRRHKAGSRTADLAAPTVSEPGQAGAVGPDDSLDADTVSDGAVTSLLPADPPPGAVVVDVAYRDGVLVPLTPLEVPPGSDVHFRLVDGSGRLEAPLRRAIFATTAPPEPLPGDPELSPNAARLPLIVAGLLAAGLGQVVLHANPPIGLALFALGIAAFVVGTYRVVAPLAREPLSPAAALRLRQVPLAAAVVLAAVAWQQSGGNRFTSLGVAAWLGCLVTWLWAWWPSRPRPALRWSSFQRWGLVIVALGLISLVALVYRFYDLANLPSEMTSDHAEKLLDVRDVLAGQRPIFFPRNTGREPAQFYLSALIAGPLGLGLTHLTLKIGTAAVSWLTVPLLFLAARRGLGAPVAVALIAAALLAISKWHVEISRQALRPAFAPLPVVLLLIFLFRALRHNDRRDWLLAGLTLGLGLYGYTPFRIAPLLVLVAVGVWWLLGRREIADRGAALTNVALLVATALLAFIPLGHYGQEQPEMFWHRSYTRVAEGASGDLWSTFWLNAWNAALMLHWRGDRVWVNTVPGDPFLDLITGALFLLGLGFLAVRIVRQRRPVDVVLLASIPILVLPSILALGWPDENPSIIRSGGVVPVIMIVAAWPLGFLAQSLVGYGRSGARHVLGAGVVIAVLGAVAALNWETYFVDYRASYDRSAWNTTEIGAVVREWAPRIGGPDHAYVKSYPHWVDTRNVAFNAGFPGWNSVFVDELKPQDLARTDREPRLAIVYPRDTQAIQQIERVWSGAEHHLVQSRVPTKEFLVYVKPGFSR
jgi:hypothetical protein